MLDLPDLLGSSSHETPDMSHHQNGELSTGSSSSPSSGSSNGCKPMMLVSTWFNIRNLQSEVVRKWWAGEIVFHKRQEVLDKNRHDWGNRVSAWIVCFTTWNRNWKEVSHNCGWSDFTISCIFSPRMLTLPDLALATTLEHWVSACWLQWMLSWVYFLLVITVSSLYFLIWSLQSAWSWTKHMVVWVYNSNNWSIVLLLQWPVNAIT